MKLAEKILIKSTFNEEEEKWEKKVKEFGFHILKMEDQIEDMIKEGKKVKGEKEIISALHNTLKAMKQAKKELENAMF